MTFMATSVLYLAVMKGAEGSLLSLPVHCLHSQQQDMGDRAGKRNAAHVSASAFKDQDICL